jgi:hypothetical protein
MNNAQTIFSKAAHGQGRNCVSGEDPDTLMVSVQSGRGPLTAIVSFSSTGLLVRLPNFDMIPADLGKVNGGKIVALAGLNYYTGSARYGYDPRTGEVRLYVATRLVDGVVSLELVTGILGEMDEAVTRYQTAMQVFLIGV